MPGNTVQQHAHFINLYPECYMMYAFEACCPQRKVLCSPCCGEVSLLCVRMCAILTTDSLRHQSHMITLLMHLPHPIICTFVIVFYIPAFKYITTPYMVISEWHTDLMLRLWFGRKLHIFPLICCFLFVINRISLILRSVKLRFYNVNISSIKYYLMGIWILIIHCTLLIWI